MGLLTGPLPPRTLRLMAGGMRLLADPEMVTVLQALVPQAQVVTQEDMVPPGHPDLVVVPQRRPQRRVRRHSPRHLRGILTAVEILTQGGHPAVGPGEMNARMMMTIVTRR
jgi:hypothetical protein